MTLRPRSPQEQMALNYLSAFSSLDATRLTSIHGPEFVHEFLPPSMSPSKTSAQFAEHVGHLKEVLKGFPVTPTDIMSDGLRHVVTIRATSKVEWREEVLRMEEAREEWVYEGSYVFFFYFEEEIQVDWQGPKVWKIVEFVDSEGTGRLRGLMKRARENIARGG